jgi:hypothetical protein
MFMKLSFVKRILIASSAVLSVSVAAQAHVPALLLPIEGTPISSYFIGQSEISRAIYSEITKPGDFLVLQMNVKAGEKTLIELLTPVCKDIPQYEKFQPSAMVFPGEIPWKDSGESNEAYLIRLMGLTKLKISSNFAQGSRAKFHEPFGNADYWVGGKWQGQLNPGLYTVVVFDERDSTGVFNISFNEKETWNRDIFKYVKSIYPKISAGFCNPKGYTGNLTPKAN